MAAMLTTPTMLLKPRIPLHHRTLAAAKMRQMRCRCSAALLPNPDYAAQTLNIPSQEAGSSDDDEEEVQVLGGENMTPEEVAAAEKRFEEQLLASSAPPPLSINWDGESCVESGFLELAWLHPVYGHILTSGNA